MRISRGRKPGAPSERRTATFTGVVWADPVLADPDQALVVNTVLFEPGARTHWHRHTVGQILQVVAGKGWAANRQGEGGVMLPGDIVHIPAGEEHWHGASSDCYMVHTAISLGTTDWLEPVGDAEYLQPKDSHAASR